MTTPILFKEYIWLVETIHKAAAKIRQVSGTANLFWQKTILPVATTLK